MATSIITGSKTVENKKLQRSITNISSQATDTQLLNFAEGLNSLSTNTLYEVRRVDTTDLLGDTRLDRNLQLVTSGTSTVVTTLSFANIGNAGTVDIITLELKGDGEFNDTELEVIRKCTGSKMLYLDWASTEDGLLITFARDSQDSSTSTTPVTGTITFSLPGNTAYKPASVTLTITE